MGLYSYAASLQGRKKSDEAASEQRQKTARSYYETEQWAELWKFKKTCKKSLTSLGFTDVEAKRIEGFKPDWI
jgi:hypothetical protein